MRNAAGLLASCILLTAGCGGSKQLTPSSAKAMVQKQIEDKKDVVEVPFDTVAELIRQPTFKDYADESLPAEGADAVVKRLFKAGLVTSTSQPLSQLDFSGAYDALDTRCWLVHLDLKIDPWPSVKGAYKAESQGCWPGPRRGETFSGVISGTATPYDSMVIHFSPGTPDGWDDAQISANSLKSDAGEDRIRLSGKASRAQFVYPISFQGNGPSRSIQVKEYQQFLEPAMGPLMRNQSASIEAGRFTIDAVENLLLAGETVAEADLKWHSELNRAGQAVTGANQLTGTGKARFRKQPDGAWVLTGYRLDR